MKKVVRILIYISVLFFVWHLYKTDYLIFENLKIDYIKAIISIVFLFGGFLVVGLSWAVALKLRGINATIKDGIVSQGIFIFSKYIPGKVWSILGRATWFSNNNREIKKLSFISLQEQLVFLWWGLALSILTAMIVVKSTVITAILILSLAGYSALIFSKALHAGFSNIVAKLLKREFSVSPLDQHFFLKTTIPVLIYWLLWSAGFYTLSLSLFSNTPLSFLLVFPAGITMGFIVIFMPAGIGIRETALTFILIEGGMEPDQAITLSIISRLWFTIGEIMMFVLATLMRTNGKAADYPEYPSTLQKEATE